MFVFKIENQNQYLCISAEMERSSMQDDNYLEHESFFASKEDILNENLQVLFFNEEKSKEYLNKINMHFIPVTKTTSLARNKYFWLILS